VACRYDFLDLLQASVVADFDDNAEAVKVLVKAARDGGFDHAAQQLRDERADTQRIQELTEELTGRGLTVLARLDYGSGAECLERLGDGDGTPLDPDQHASCAGHAAYIAHGWEYDDNDTAIRTAEVVYVCTDVKGYGHQPRYATISSPTRTPASEMSEAEREEAREQRRTVIANNRAWASAETVRRSWLRTFLARSVDCSSRRACGAPGFGWVEAAGRRWRWATRLPGRVTCRGCSCRWWAGWSVIRAGCGGSSALMVLRCRRSAGSWRI
jgi:ParB family chromosome partitioning protein